MFYTLQGRLTIQGDTFFVIECAGIGFKVYTNKKTRAALPAMGNTTTVFSSLIVRNEQFEIYGFLEESALKFFEMLNNVQGVGPKTALGLIDLDTVPNIMAAIIERRIDILTKASGIGRKTAERIVLELQNRIKLSGSETIAKKIDMNCEVEEVLVELGYSRAEVRRIIQKFDSTQHASVEEYLRRILKELGRERLL